MKISIKYMEEIAMDYRKVLADAKKIAEEYGLTKVELDYSNYQDTLKTAKNLAIKYGLREE